VVGGEGAELFEGLAALLQGANSGGGTLSYELPEVEYPSFLRGCLERWSK